MTTLAPFDMPARAPPKRAAKKPRKTKRKAAAYEADDAGFQFSTVAPAKKVRAAEEEEAGVAAQKSRKTNSRTQQAREEERGQPVTKTTRSTRGRKRAESPPLESLPTQSTHPASTARPRRQRTPQQATTRAVEPTPQKIALPFADTPVLRRNKEMRLKQSKAAGGQRRSSLGMRGRRASSLIESGASSALPHDEVRTEEFYKHIEGDGLPEPRRMRQLLTWCATRAMAQRPRARSAASSEHQSAVLAARIVQDEILKEFSVRSELSDWFSREETDAAAAVVRRPHPKNEQNGEKIAELEAQIEVLRREKRALNALLSPPVVPEVGGGGGGKSEEEPSFSGIDASVLDPSQQQLLQSLSLPPPSIAASGGQTQPPDTAADAQFDTSIDAITRRLSRLTTSLLPTIDTFAAGIQDIELYRAVADDAAGSILRTCARSLEARDRARAAAARRKEKGREYDDDDDDDDGVSDTGIRREDLAFVLGALSRMEQQEQGVIMA